MVSRTYIDLGSSTIKAARISDNKFERIKEVSYPFKKEFDPEKGFSVGAKKQIFCFINSLKSETDSINTYATALYRKLTPLARIALEKEFIDNTGVKLNIISHEQENYYLELALLGRCDLIEPVLLINIGGGSTELIVVENKQVLQRQNINIGAGSIMADFPTLDDKFSGFSLSEVVEKLVISLPALNKNIKKAFYSGGELRYMQVVNYPLEENTFFKDPDHPSIIHSKKFKIKNQEVFSKISMQELEKLIPENPGWMHGARACSALAQAICDKYGIDILIPSNSNLLDGVARESFLG